MQHVSSKSVMAKAFLAALVLMLGMWFSFWTSDDDISGGRASRRTESGTTSTPTIGPQVDKLAADMVDPKVLNVHIVPHTHDDVGWLKTVEQYYFGLNMSIQADSVQDILDSVVAALLENPSRTFTYVEQKFFSMWWERQNDAVRDSVRFLVANKQLSFANGGWCMHDEAAAHFIGMIDQTTLGHSFLLKELGVVPKVGWQLDPFGHSATQASLFASKLGFDALYFGRIDYQDLRLRQLEQECEGLWNSSRSLEDSSVFWGLTGSYNGNYGSPTGFCFDINCEDPSLIDMNQTEEMDAIRDLLRKIRVQSDRTKGSHIMLTMGSDFQYQRARVNFANLDMMIGKITELQQWNKIDIARMFGPRFEHVKIFYSSPEYYTKCKHDELQVEMLPHDGGIKGAKEKTSSLTVKKDDFFPYSDCEHCYWTGYFTSRPNFKRFERVASSFLLAARQIESTIDYTGKLDPVQCGKQLHELEDASGVVQHHDGVSGTAKQHVTYDYAKRLQQGIDAVSPCVIRKLKRILLGKNASDYLEDLSFCQLLNETTCEVSQKATEKNGTDVYVVVYNSLVWERSTIVHLPVSSDGDYQVSKVGSEGAPVSMRSSYNNAQGKAGYVVHFDTGSLPPLGANIYKVFATPPGEKLSENTILLPPTIVSRRRTKTYISTEDVEAQNEFFSVIFDRSTGNIKQMKTSDTTVDLTQTWGYYTSFDSRFDKKTKDDRQNSGAYIFRPSTPEQALRLLKPSSARFYNTSVGMEVHVEYEESWIKTITRVMPGQQYLEIEYTIGPVPIGDNRGKEIVTRFSTPIESSSTFYTDSNGREFMKRKRNHRPTWDLNVFEPVAGNYYPVNAAMYIEDDAGKALAVATDRSQGGASLVDGAVELMVQRRTLVDDSRGVDEPLNETDVGITPCWPDGNATRLGEGVVMKGTHRIRVGAHGGATIARSMMDSAFADPLVFVGSSPAAWELPFRVSNFSGLAEPLPHNVMLITRSLLNDESKTTFLLRLAHQYGIDEDKVLSKPVKVDLAACFPGYDIVAAGEHTLSGNQRHGSWLKTRLNWIGESSKASRVPLRGTQFELSPMEIRTFKVSVNASFA